MEDKAGAAEGEREEEKGGGMMTIGWELMGIGAEAAGARSVVVGRQRLRDDDEDEEGWVCGGAERVCEEGGGRSGAT